MAEPSGHPATSTANRVDPTLVTRGEAEPASAPRSGADPLGAAGLAAGGLTSVLVANRGEIACRILRTVRWLGLRGIAVHSEDDAAAAHVAAADEARAVDGAGGYLDADRLVAAARDAGADAVHPGYGFLAEAPEFARTVRDAGLVWVGPPPEAIARMGDKVAAKAAARAAGVPVVPGVHEAGDGAAADGEAAGGRGVSRSDAALREAAEREVGYPMLVKAAAGGGGRGMRVVRAPDELEAALTGARREAAAAFGSDVLLVERLVERPRHIEVQVLADGHGTVVAVGDRECSLQRRHQKIVEEAPAPGLDAATRAEMAEAAVAVAHACGYEGAGTVEFVRSSVDGAWYFLEMNTRLQVEHPVTELVAGLDLVAWQLAIAAGARLDPALHRAAPRGHAVEARIGAEDPSRGFLPTGGQVHAVAWPDDPDARHPAGAGADGVRVDAGIGAGEAVGSEYDSLLAKVIAHGPDRASALDRLDRALARTRVLGPGTSTGYLRRLLATPEVRAGEVDTAFVEARPELAAAEVPDDALAAAALCRLRDVEAAADAGDPFARAGGWRIGEDAWVRWRVRAGERIAEVAVRGRADDAEVALDEGAPRRGRTGAVGADASAQVTLDGVTRRWGYHADGDRAWIEQDGQAWELSWADELAAARTDEQASSDGVLLAPMPGTVAEVRASVGDEVTRGQPVVVVEAMKMAHPVVAPVDGVVAEVGVAVGDQVAMEQALARVDPEG